MRRREFITLVVLSGEEKKARGCDVAPTAREIRHYLQ
jgi:hypothetical protein